MNTSRPAACCKGKDSGAAIIITLMVMALVGALAATLTTVAINDLQSSRRAQEAGVALNAADAGVAEGLAYLRANGARKLCPQQQAPSYNPNTPTFTSGFDLSSETCVTSLDQGHRVAGKPYTVVIVTEAPFPANDVGRYAIFSTGVGAGLASRLVSAKVEFRGIGIPKGFFGHTVGAGGGVGLANQSIFSTGCVYKRLSITNTGTDGYGLPAAVHSSKIVTDDQGSLPTCSSSVKAIHAAGPCKDLATPNTRFDHDSLGDVFPSGSPCLARRADYPGVTAAMWDKYYPQGSKLTDDQMLKDVFAIKDPPLNDGEVDLLRRIAQAQQNYFGPSDTIPSAIVPKGREAVLFFDLTGNAKINLGQISGFTPPATGCLDGSLIVVIVGGGAYFPSGTLAASLFVMTPGQDYQATGGSVVGTVFADSISLAGNTNISDLQRQCFDANPSPRLLDVNITSYRELDTL